MGFGDCKNTYEYRCHIDKMLTSRQSRNAPPR